MRTLLHLPLEIATAFFFAASIGIGAGAVATSYTHRLGDGVRMALVGFLVAAAGFGYVIWRHYRPRSRPGVRRLRAPQMAPR
ncbi:MAG: hypothetical protein K2X43_04410 [Hyphomonadaceae bacterium]|nr:hypothetical protein [Hyphomonadaceae bacterium]